MTTPDPTARDEISAIADRLFSAIEAGDLDAVRSIYADDAVIWHNNDEVEQRVDENLRTLRWVVTNLQHRRYTDVRRWLTAEGFVQQHVLRVTNRAGVEVALPVCLAVRVADGRITRIDEYLDSRHVDQLFASAPER